MKPLGSGGYFMKIYTIIGGVNGVGKSSFTGVLKERTTDLGVIIDVDKITAELGGDLLIGGKASINKIDDCIAKRISFTQETTLSGRRTENTAKKVKDLGYHVRLFYVGLDTVEESLERIKNRVKRGGHDIPNDNVAKRFQGRWEAVSKVLPYCDEAEFYDNDNGFVKVAEYRNGEFRRIGTNTCTWVDELGEYLKANL
jgi:predicted ABC-type ATPase